ncbi:hypothetical protein LC593_20420 [Nostoc sp. CHAB 5844]|nr:hypothetical protein [Nostoc sp. CHAB 5844]
MVRERGLGGFHATSFNGGNPRNGVASHERLPRMVSRLERTGVAISVSVPAIASTGGTPARRCSSPNFIRRQKLLFF